MTQCSWTSFLTEYVRVTDYKVLQLEVHPLTPGKLQHAHGSSSSERLWFSDRHLQEILQLVKTAVFERINQPLKESKNTKAQILTGPTIRLGYAFKKKTEHQTCLILRNPGQFSQTEPNTSSSDDSLEEAYSTSCRYRNYQIHREKMVVYVLPREEAGTSQGIKALVDAMNDCKQPKVDISSYFIKSPDQKQTSTKSSQDSQVSSYPIGSKQALTLTSENEPISGDVDQRTKSTNQRSGMGATSCDQRGLVISVGDDFDVPSDVGIVSTPDLIIEEPPSTEDGTDRASEDKGDVFDQSQDDKRKRLKKIIQQGSLKLSKRKKGKQKLRRDLQSRETLSEFRENPLPTRDSIDESVRVIVDDDDVEQAVMITRSEWGCGTDCQSTGYLPNLRAGTSGSSEPDDSSEPADSSDPSAGTSGVSTVGGISSISSIEFDINNKVAVLRLDKVPKLSKTALSLNPNTKMSDKTMGKVMSAINRGTEESSDQMETIEEETVDQEFASTSIDKDCILKEYNDVEIVRVNFSATSDEEEEIMIHFQETSEENQSSNSMTDPSDAIPEDPILSTLGSKSLSGKGHIATKGSKLARIRKTGLHSPETPVTVKDKFLQKQKKLQALLDSDSEEGEWHFSRKSLNKPSAKNQKENIDNSYVDMTKRNLCSPTKSRDEVEIIHSIDDDDCHSIARDSPTFEKKEKCKDNRTNLGEREDSHRRENASLLTNKSRKRKSSGSRDSEKASPKKSEEKMRKTLKLSKGRSYQRTNSAPQLVSLPRSASPVKNCSVKLKKLSDITLRNAINLPPPPPKCTMDNWCGQNRQLPWRLSSRMSAIFKKCETLPEVVIIDADVESELECIPDKSLSDACSIKDEEAELLWKSVHSVNKVSDLNTQELLFIIHENEKYLREIFQGKMACKRHQDYKAGGKHRNNLTYQVHFGVFSDEQGELVMETLMSMFCHNHNKYLDYLMKVLLPEMLVKVYMEVYEVEHEKAESLMQEHMISSGGM